MTDSSPLNTGQENPDDLPSGAQLVNMVDATSRGVFTQGMEMYASADATSSVNRTIAELDRFGQDIAIGPEVNGRYALHFRDGTDPWENVCYVDLAAAQLLCPELSPSESEAPNALPIPDGCQVVSGINENDQYGMYFPGEIVSGDSIPMRFITEIQGFDRCEGRVAINQTTGEILLYITDDSVETPGWQSTEVHMHPSSAASLGVTITGTTASSATVEDTTGTTSTEVTDLLEESPQLVNLPLDPDSSFLIYVGDAATPAFVRISEIMGSRLSGLSVNAISGRFYLGGQPTEYRFPIGEPTSSPSGIKPLIDAAFVALGGDMIEGAPLCRFTVKGSTLLPILEPGEPPRPTLAPIPAGEKSGGSCEVTLDGDTIILNGRRVLAEPLDPSGRQRLLDARENPSSPKERLFLLPIDEQSRLNVQMDSGGSPQLITQAELLATAAASSSTPLTNVVVTVNLQDRRIFANGKPVACKLAGPLQNVFDQCRHGPAQNFVGGNFLTRQIPRDQKLKYIDPNDSDNEKEYEIKASVHGNRPYCLITIDNRGQAVINGNHVVPGTLTDQEKTDIAQLSPAPVPRLFPLTVRPNESLNITDHGGGTVANVQSISNPNYTAGTVVSVDIDSGEIYFSNAQTGNCNVRTRHRLNSSAAELFQKSNPPSPTSGPYVIRQMAANEELQLEDEYGQELPVFTAPTNCRIFVSRQQGFVLVEREDGAIERLVGRLTETRRAEIIGSADSIGSIATPGRPPCYFHLNLNPSVQYVLRRASDNATGPISLSQLVQTGETVNSAGLDTATGEIMINDRRTGYFLDETYSGPGNTQLIQESLAQETSNPADGDTPRTIRRTVAANYVIHNPPNQPRYVGNPPNAADTCELIIDTETRACHIPGQALVAHRLTEQQFEALNEADENIPVQRETLYRVILPQESKKRTWLGTITGKITNIPVVGKWIEAGVERYRRWNGTGTHTAASAGGFVAMGQLVTAGSETARDAASQATLQSLAQAPSGAVDTVVSSAWTVGGVFATALPAALKDGGKFLSPSFHAQSVDEALDGTLNLLAMPGDTAQDIARLKMVVQRRLDQNLAQNDDTEVLNTDDERALAEGLHKSGLMTVGNTPAFRSLELYADYCFSQLVRLCGNPSGYPIDAEDRETIEGLNPLTAITAEERERRLDALFDVATTYARATYNAHENSKGRNAAVGVGIGAGFAVKAVGLVVGWPYLVAAGLYGGKELAGYLWRKHGQAIKFDKRGNLVDMDGKPLLKAEIMRNLEGFVAQAEGYRGIDLPESRTTRVTALTSDTAKAYYGRIVIPDELVKASKTSEALCQVAAGPVLKKLDNKPSVEDPETRLTIEAIVENPAIAEAFAAKCDDKIDAKNREKAEASGKKTIIGKTWEWLRESPVARNGAKFGAGAALTYYYLTKIPLLVVGGVGALCLLGSSRESTDTTKKAA